MLSLRPLLLSGIGIFAGGLIAVQSVLNATLGQRIGNLGSVLVITLSSTILLVGVIFLVPSASNFRELPDLSEWPLYMGGIIGVAILAASISLVPRIGTTSTLIAMVLGQSLIALGIDHFGLFASPKIAINLARGVGLLLVAVGAYLVGR
ncbi:MAG: DMT family transporter [Chloroflexi bacterium]|nr:DMT family transporter [Chloroflexota bacterium]